MTREEAIEYLDGMKIVIPICNELKELTDERNEAIDMAIEALQADTVSREEYEKVLIECGEVKTRLGEIEALTEPSNCVKCKHYYETEDDTGVHGHCRMDTIKRDEVMEELQRWSIKASIDLFRRIEGLSTYSVSREDTVTVNSPISIVVRCKDCRQYIPYDLTEAYGWCCESKTIIEEDEFCSRGERREK